MGTLGCINDMMQRDKENRELRKVGKKRMSETHGRLLGLTSKRRSSDISPEKLEQIQAEKPNFSEATIRQVWYERDNGVSSLMPGRNRSTDCVGTKELFSRKVNIYYHCSCSFSIDMAGDFVAFVESAVL